LKKSAEDYANHAENTLSKLGRVYLKKYQDYVRPVETPRRTLDPSNKSIGSRFSSLFRGRREAEGAESDVAEPEEVGASRKVTFLILPLNSFLDQFPTRTVGRRFRPSTSFDYVESKSWRMDTRYGTF